MKEKFNKFGYGIVMTTLVIVALVGNCFIMAPRVMAAHAFTVSPMQQKIVLVPGETYHGSITVSNPAASEEDFQYLVTVAPYNVTAGQNSKDSYGGSDFTTTSNRNEIVKWIKLNNPTGSVKSNEKVAISFSIDVPKDAPAGGQYASLAVQENPNADVLDGSVAVQEVMQMSHIIYAEVAGETVKKGAVTENNIPSFLLNGPLEATSMVKNEGNVHTDAEYIFQVWPMFSDEEICTNEENPSTSLVLPDTERYHTESCNLPMVGIFRAKQTVKIFGDESIVEKTIVICPIWLMLVVAFVIIAAIVWLVMRVRSRKKKAAEN